MSSVGAHLYPGIRVGIVPWGRNWSNGERFGVITSVGKGKVSVRMARTGKVRRYPASEVVRL